MWSVVLGTKADSLEDQCKHNRLLRGEETEARALDIIRAPTCVLNLIPWEERRTVNKLENLGESPTSGWPPRLGSPKSPMTQAGSMSVCQHECFLPNACFQRRKQMIFTSLFLAGRLGGVRIKCVGTCKPFKTVPYCIIVSTQ